MDEFIYENLNEARIPEQFGEKEMDDYSDAGGQTEVYFRDIKQTLIEKIYGAEVVLGCVAWLTDADILNALAKKCTSIVVQKEDFLRPDSGEYRRAYLKDLYGKITGDIMRCEMAGTILTEVSYADANGIGGIRCVGNHNADKKPAHPRMHNKFIVFCKRVDMGDQYQQPIVPYAVWTGSFNFTYNATNSFENAVFIKNKKVARAYYREFAQIMAISEPLDWKSRWVAPEWRIGS
jgi:hypothetical protein